MNHEIMEWAKRHGVTMQALHELTVMWGMDRVFGLREKGGTSEAAVATQVVLEASQLGIRLWRNNVGAGHLDNGSYIRWGLANESKDMNKMIKSSDYIGVRPVLITAQMVGSTIGQFVARETKEAGWTYSGDDHEVAQFNFIQFVNSKGGDAKFAAGLGTF